MGINLGAIAGGINQGMDWAQRDQQIADQRAMQQEQMEQWRKENEYRGGLQKRQTDAWKREDQLASDLESVQKPGTQSLIPGTDVGPTQDGGTVAGIYRTQTKIDEARQRASAYEKARQYDQAAKLNAWADEQGLKAGADAFHTFNTSYKGNNAFDYASGLSRIITDDQSPVTVAGVEDLGGGRVRAQLKNRNTGFSTTAEFGSVDELRQAALRHYDPTTYQKQIDRAIAKQDKIDEERAKPVKLTPGEESYSFDPSTGQYVRMATNANESPTVTAARIRAGGGAGGAGGSGTGTGGASTKGSGVFQILDKLVDPAVDGQFRTRAYANAEVIAQLNPNIPDGINAQASMEYAKNPASARVSYDPATGRWARAIDMDGRRVIVNDRLKKEEISSALPAEADALYDKLKSSGSPLAAPAPANGEPDTRMLAAARREMAEIQIRLAKESGRKVNDPEVIKESNQIFDQRVRPVLESQAEILKSSKAAQTASRQSPSQRSQGGAQTQPGGLRRPQTEQQDPLAGKSQQQIWKIRDQLKAEREKYISSGQSIQAGPRIREIDEYLDRINTGRY